MEVQAEVEEGLKKYRVTFHYSGSANIDIEAQDEEDAKEKAEEEISTHDIEWEDLEHTDVELLTEPDDD